MMWNQFLELRNEKVASEERLTKLRQRQEELTKHALAQEEEAASALAELDRVEKVLRTLREDRAREVYDVEASP